MIQYHFRNGYEEKTGNAYAVVFDVYLCYPVQVQHEGNWVDPNTIPQLQSIIQKIPQKRWWDSSIRYLYASDDVVTYIDKDILFLAIGRNPMGKHELLRRSAINTFQWYQDRHIYNLVTQAATLISDWPEFSYSSVVDELQPNYWVLEPWSAPAEKRGSSLFTKYNATPTRLMALPSTNMTLQSSFALQIDHQIPLYDINGLLKAKGSMRYFQKQMLAAIYKNISNRLQLSQKVYVPYVGHFNLRGTRLCFSASRLLKDRLKGKSAASHRIKAGRIYGGEIDPGQSIVLWKDQYQLSQRRNFVWSMLENVHTHYRNIAVANVVYQAFTDALIFRLCQGVPVTLKGIGTLRPQNGRVSFRKSKTFSIDSDQE